MKYEKSDDQERLGVSIVEESLARLGQIFREQPKNDVGIDAHLELVTPERDATGQLVGIQIKAGPSFLKEKNDDSFVYRGDESHRRYWLSHCLPMVLVLVDTGKRETFWQNINQEQVESTGKGWKVRVPFKQNLNAEFLSAASHAVGLTVSSSSYTLLSLRDTSNALVKRYSAHILLRPPVNRMRVEAVARLATSAIKKQTYLANPESKKHLLKMDAAVVSLYIALDPSDAEHANWFARTLWIDPGLEKENRPGSIGGDVLGDGLEIVWGAAYASDAGLYRAIQVEKGEFLPAVRDVLARTQNIVGTVFGEDGLTPAEGITQSDLNASAGEMRTLYLASGDIGLPPLDCADVGARFNDIMALADNAFLLVNKNIQDEQAESMNAFVLEKTLKEYRENLGYLNYEIEKIR